MTQSIAIQNKVISEFRLIHKRLVAFEAACTKAQKDIISELYTLNQLQERQLAILVDSQQSLLNEYYDFFLLSQGSLASPDLRELATKHAMPARMWKHGVEDPLKMLSNLSPRSSEHLWNFFIIAYSMLALLYETVPNLKITWAECLGDLSRYCPEVRYLEQVESECWRDTARFWLCKVSDQLPTTGRLYHHLATAAPNGSVEQLFYFVKSVRVRIPFPVTCQTITKFFEKQQKPKSKTASLEHYFVKAHIAIWFGEYQDSLKSNIDSFLEVMDLFADDYPDSWRSLGPYMAATLGCATIKPMTKNTVEERSVMHLLHDEMRNCAYDFMIHVVNKILTKRDRDEALPFIHILLIYVSHIVRHRSWLDASFPWALLVDRLNGFIVSIDVCKSSRYDVDHHFPMGTSMKLSRPLPEDFILRGLPYANCYFPKDWFTNTDVEENERYVEHCWMSVMRKRRILFLACGIAQHGRLFKWNPTIRRFSKTPNTGISQI